MMRSVQHPEIVYSASSREMSPYGGVVIWNPKGTARLKHVCGPFSIPPPYSRSLAKGRARFRTIRSKRS